MSKRSKPEGGNSSHTSSSTKLSQVEQKLLELQIFTDDILHVHNANNCTLRSTRAFADPMLNIEIKLLQQRISELEKSQNPAINSEEMKKLASDNEELRTQIGDVSSQMRLQQLEAKDKMIQNLVRSLAQAKKEVIESLSREEALSAQVLLLQRRLQAQTQNERKVGDDDFDSFFAEVAGSNS